AEAGVFVTRIRFSNVCSNWTTLSDRIVAKFKCVVQRIVVGQLGISERWIRRRNRRRMRLHGQRLDRATAPIPPDQLGTHNINAQPVCPRQVPKLFVKTRNVLSQPAKDKKTS